MTVTTRTEWQFEPNLHRDHIQGIADRLDQRIAEWRDNPGDDARWQEVELYERVLVEAQRTFREWRNLVKRRREIREVCHGWNVDWGVCSFTVYREACPRCKSHSQELEVHSQLLEDGNITEPTFVARCTDCGASYDPDWYGYTP